MHLLKKGNKERERKGAISCYWLHFELTMKAMREKALIFHYRSFFFHCLQGGGAGAHGEMEREVRIFMQDERQRVHGRARSVHFKDICEKGESKLTFRLRREHRLGWERNERKTERFFSTLVFTDILLFVHTPMLAIIPQTENQL